MKVYVVRYSCDEYSDYYDKPISAWLDRNQAKAEMAVLNEKLRKARKVYNRYTDHEKAEKKAQEILPEFDPDQNEYFMEEVELYGELKDEK